MVGECFDALNLPTMVVGKFLKWLKIRENLKIINYGVIKLKMATILPKIQFRGTTAKRKKIYSLTTIAINTFISFKLSANKLERNYKQQINCLTHFSIRKSKHGINMLTVEFSSLFSVSIYASKHRPINNGQYFQKNSPFYGKRFSR